MKAERKPSFGGRSERLGQDEQRLGVFGSRHLEHVERSVDRRVDQRHEAHRARGGELLDRRARALSASSATRTGSPPPRPLPRALAPSPPPSLLPPQTSPPPPPPPSALVAERICSTRIAPMLELWALLRRPAIAEAELREVAADEPDVVRAHHGRDEAAADLDTAAQHDAHDGPDADGQRVVALRDVEDLGDDADAVLPCVPKRNA